MSQPKLQYFLLLIVQVVFVVGPVVEGFDTPLGASVVLQATVHWPLGGKSIDSIKTFLLFVQKPFSYIPDIVIYTVSFRRRETGLLTCSNLRSRAV